MRLWQMQVLQVRCLRLRRLQVREIIALSDAYFAPRRSPERRGFFRHHRLHCVDAPALDERARPIDLAATTIATELAMLASIQEFFLTEKERRLHRTRHRATVAEDTLVRSSGSVKGHRRECPANDPTTAAKWRGPEVGYRPMDRSRDRGRREGIFFPCPCHEQRQRGAAAWS